MTGVLDLVAVYINSSQVVNYSLGCLKASICVLGYKVLSSLSFSTSIDIDYLVILCLKVIYILLKFALYL